MVGYKIDNSQLTKTLSFNLTLFQRLAQVYDNSMYIAGTLAVKLTKDRIQNEGTAADGQRLLTRSSSPIGAYGQRHGKKRQKRGLQTAYVDATYTGALFRSFRLLSYKGKRAEVGTDSTVQGEKIQEMEALYNAPIFEPTDEDEDLVIDAFEKELFGTLMQVFPYS